MVFNYVDFNLVLFVEDAEVSLHILFFIILTALGVLPTQIEPFLWNSSAI